MSSQLDQVVAWAAHAVGGSACRPTGVVPLRPNGSPWLLELEVAGTSLRAVLKAGSVGMRAELASEAAALVVAEAHDLATPRLLAADLDGDETGGPAALVMSHVDGSDRLPAAVDPGRLRALGAAAAAIHQVSMGPTPELPMRCRHMPWIDLSAERRHGDAPTTALLERGDQLVDRIPEPRVETVFVHGDLWAGNTLWREDRHVATIDWEAAGVGSYGVDLGSLRFDAALLHGPGAADDVLAGWEEATGHRAESVAYWDLVAALNTLPDMAAFTPTMHQAGRADLDGSLLTARRDAFLTTAIGELC